MIKYKIDVLEHLRMHGYGQNQLRKFHIGSSTITRLKQSQEITFSTLNTLCKLLECDVSDIIEYVPD